jgi:hypothetical protein
VPGPSTGEEEVETPSEHSMASGLPLQTRAPRDATPSSTDLAQWPTTHLVGMIRASTDQLEKRLQQARGLSEFAREEVFLVQACRKQEEHAKIQVEHRLERVQERLVEAWPEIRKVAPQLPEASDAGEPEHQIELLQGAWSQLAIHVEHMEVQLWKTQQEAEKQPRKLQEKMEKIVLEGNNARATLHKRTTECTNIFREVSDWMGIIARCNQTLEDVCTRIQVLNEEVVATMDPLEKQQKFDQIQQADNELNALFEVQSVAKKELRDFRPVIQTVYMQMHQVDATTDSEWNSLVASKPKGCITDATQQFMAEASLLARKWQDKVGSFQEVKKWALELVPELGPSFEEAKEEKVQAEEKKKEEKEDKGKQQLLLEAAKEPST